MQDFDRLLAAMGENKLEYPISSKEIPLAVQAEQVMSVRNAYFSGGEVLPVEQALGCICRMPTATCPPAIPIVVPGERIDETAVKSFKYYGIDFVEVVKQ